MQMKIPQLPLLLQMASDYTFLCLTLKSCGTRTVAYFSLGRPPKDKDRDGKETAQVCLPSL